MIQSLDEGVGRIAARIDALGLAENTLVVFYSDNGGSGGYERDGLVRFSPTSNEPLRGGKGMLFEGGIRVPLIARWPGVVAAGTTSEALVTSTDFFPTFLALAGREPDAGPHGRLQPAAGAARRRARDAGARRNPLALPELPAGRDREGHLAHHPLGGDPKRRFEADRVVRGRAPRAIRSPARLGETHDLAREMPEKAKELQQKLVAWRQATNAPMATPKPK